NAYKITLVAAFVPLVVGLYWKRATSQGALLSALGGLLSWSLLELLAPDSIWPPQLVGLLFSMGGMALGSLVPQWARRPIPA
ncbi:MAG: sodium:solute symporter, partial [Herbaspirillum sp.]